MPQIFDSVYADLGTRSLPGYSFNGFSGSGMFYRSSPSYIAMMVDGYEVFRGRAFTTVSGNLIGSMAVGLASATTASKAVFQVYESHNGMYVNKTDLGGSFLGGVCGLGFNIYRDEAGNWGSFGDSGAVLNGGVLLDFNKSGDMIISNFPSAAGTDLARTAAQVVAGRTWRFTSLKGIVPETDNVSDIGTSSKRIRNIFLVNQPTVTSDATVKDNARLLSDAEMQAWASISPKIYSLRGDTMLQAGLLAQDVINAFSAKGLDVAKYSLIMKDPATNLYAIRYGECAMFEAAYQRSQVTKLNAAVNRLLTTLGLGGLLGV